MQAACEIPRHAYVRLESDEIKSEESEKNPCPAHPPHRVSSLQTTNPLSRAMSAHPGRESLPNPRDTRITLKIAVVAEAVPVNARDPLVSIGGGFDIAAARANTRIALFGIFLNSME